MNKERIREKMEVKTMVNPIRSSTRFTKYRTRMAIVGSNDEKIAAKELLIFIIRSSLYCLNPVPG